MADRRIDRIIKKLDGRFSPEHEKALRKLLSFRNKLTKSFEIGYIKNLIVGLVEESSYVDFFNSRARKFISDDQPVFRLKVPITDEALKAYPDGRLERMMTKGLKVESAPHLEAATAFKLTVLHYEVMDPLLTLLLEKVNRLSEEDETLSVEREEVFKTLPDEEDLGRFLIPNIFKVLVESVKGDLVIMEYVP